MYLATRQAPARKKAKRVIIALPLFDEQHGSVNVKQVPKIPTQADYQYTPPKDWYWLSRRAKWYSSMINSINECELLVESAINKKQHNKITKYTQKLSELRTQLATDTDSLGNLVRHRLPFSEKLLSEIPDFRDLTDEIKGESPRQLLKFFDNHHSYKNGFTIDDLLKVAKTALCFKEKGKPKNPDRIGECYERVGIRELINKLYLKLLKAEYDDQDEEFDNEADEPITQQDIENFNKRWH